MKKKNITNEELLTAMESGFGKVYKRLDQTATDASYMKVEMNGLRKDVDELKENAFTKDEKNDVLNMVENINQRLEDETLGRESITLTRDEYDGVDKTVPFENRFEKVGK